MDESTIENLVAAYRALADAWTHLHAAQDYDAAQAVRDQAFHVYDRLEEVAIDRDEDSAESAFGIECI